MVKFIVWVVATKYWWYSFSGESSLQYYAEISLGVWEQDNKL